MTKIQWDLKNRRIIRKAQSHHPDKQLNININIYYLLRVSCYPAVSVWERVILYDQYPTQWTQSLDTAVGTYNRSMLSTDLCQTWYKDVVVVPLLVIRYGQDRLLGGQQLALLGLISLSARLKGLSYGWLFGVR